MPVPNVIKAPFLDFTDQDLTLRQIDAELNLMPKIAIANTPWPEFLYRPECLFSIAHNDDFIFLKYFVIEDAVMARFTQPNDLVYQDSCVEFFIAFDEESYYNLEFNCIGTCYVGFGRHGETREVADTELVESIERSSLLYSYEGKIRWELTLKIPRQVFYNHNIQLLQGKTCRANFYKCGDDLPQPHYLAWNNIESEQPNFHLPAFFGDLVFAAPDQPASSSSI